MSAPSSLLQCPTPPDGAEILIAQTIPPTLCQKRQRGLYHKCWTCAHRGAEAKPAVGALAQESPAPVLDMPAQRRAV